MKKYRSYHKMRSNRALEINCCNKDFLELTNHFPNRFSVIILLPEKIPNRNIWAIIFLLYSSLYSHLIHLMYPQFKQSSYIPGHVYIGSLCSACSMFTEEKTQIFYYTFGNCFSAERLEWLKDFCLWLPHNCCMRREKFLFRLR